MPRQLISTCRRKVNKTALIRRVQSVKVSSLNNGSGAFRLEWYDLTKDDAVNMPDKFSDACAISFRLKRRYCSELHDGR